MIKKIICVIILLHFAVLINAQTLTGVASYYNNSFNGKRTANGEIFSNSKMTCACNRLPLNTQIRVTNLKNNKSVIVKVNDRLAASNKRVVDLSFVAAQQLGFINSGLTQVRVEVLQKNMPKQLDKKIKTNNKPKVAKEKPVLEVIEENNINRQTDSIAN